MRPTLSCRLFMLCALAALSANLHADPAPVKNAVFKPTFKTDSGTFTAGTAFLCEYPGKKTVVLMTAQHLFGPAGGFPADIPWNHLKAAVKEVTVVSMNDPAVHLSVKQAVPIEGAHAIDQTGMQDDIAVFETDAPITGPALKLAEVAPAIGDRVWLYGRQRGSEALELVPATVMVSSRKELRYGFDADRLSLGGTSGASVLNAGGEVVAINIGGNFRGGRQIGFGNPMSSVRNHLQKAMQKTP